MNKDSISAEIAAIIDRRIASNNPVPVTWVVHEFMGRHNQISGPDTDFHRLTAYAYVKDVAKRLVGKFDDVEVDSTRLLPGFEHLRIAYTVSRDGQSILVPVDQCTDEELIERAEMFERGAAGLVSHAKEIRTFVGVRGAADRALA